MSHPSNDAVAARLDEAAALLAGQGANPFRVRAYRRGADALRQLPEPVAAVLASAGLAGLEQLPDIGPGLARSIRDIVRLGYFPMLERLRGDADPVRVLTSVPGIGRRFARRLHDELGVASLEDLEAAAHDGRMAALPGFGPKRTAGIRDVLAYRLARIPRQAGDRATRVPPVGELLALDREYLDAAAAGRLPVIAPRRFNPGGRPWLPVLHATRGDDHYTVLFSNTATAHRLGRTRDWVVIYRDADSGDGQWTVVTARGGPFAGRRVVRGREAECRRHYADTLGAARVSG